LTDSFAPAFYVSGTEERLVQLRDAAQRKTTELVARFTERIDLWLNAPRQVLEISVLCPSDFLGLGTMGAQTRLETPAVQQRPYGRFSLLLGEADLPAGVLSKSKRTRMAKSNRSCAAMTNGPSTTKCRRSNSCRFASQAFHDRSHPRPPCSARNRSGWEMLELDEAGEPPAIQFAHMLKREDPDVILSEWGDSTILPCSGSRLSA